MLSAVGLWTSARASERAQERSVWVGVYTDRQAEVGERLYATGCAVCHADDLSGGGFAPALVDEPFIQHWKDGPLADLFVVLKGTMPQDKPGSLSDEDYAAITAFLLKKNHFPSGSTALRPDADDLKKVVFRKP
jgi:mono/diheme cytochrome c family protein